MRQKAPEPVPAAGTPPPAPVSGPRFPPAPAERPATVGEILGSAVALHQSGRLAEAEALYRQVLEVEPANADALHLSGVVAHQAGRHADAAVLIAKAIKKAPRNPSFHLNLANAEQALGHPDKAAAAIGKALKLDPGWAEALNSLGVVRAGQEKLARAIGHFNKAIALKPDYADAHNNLGIALAKLGKFEEAIEAHGKALAIEPENAEVLNAMGTTLRDFGRHDDAICRYERALALHPGHPEALNNMGVALNDLGRADEAIDAYRKAIEARPDHAEAYRNLAKPLIGVDDIEGAIEACTQALRIRPDYAAARWERALPLLLAGRFDEAWEDYLARPTVERKRIRPPTEPLPQDLAGKRVLLEGEQGLGDQIYFLNFAPALKARGAEVMARVDPKIAEILGDLPFVDRVLGPKEKPGHYDAAYFLGDLPYLLGADDPPPPIALTADGGRVAEIAARLRAFGPPPYIGVTWQAGIADAGRLYKEAPMDLLSAALAPLKATVIALQRHPDAGEIAGFARALGREPIDLTALNEDLPGMLALMTVIDDYVGVSNTNTYIRAGTGRAARVLVPHPPEFRWMAKGDTSPWFPGFTVYRQRRDGDWGEAADALTRDLAAA
jgi:tetratricopeptide (TPR) repeat protein